MPRGYAKTLGQSFSATHTPVILSFFPGLSLIRANLLNLARLLPPRV